MTKGVGRGNLVVEMTAAGHKLISGVPEKLGGKDEGPESHALLEAALVSCTALTVHMYANRKGWPLESTEVSAHITSESREESHIERQVSFHGDLSEEQRVRLFEIANRCPIHRLLESKITIHSKRVDA